MLKKYHVPIMDSGAIETFLGLLSHSKTETIYSKLEVRLAILQLRIAESFPHAANYDN